MGVHGCAQVCAGVPAGVRGCTRVTRPRVYVCARRCTRVTRMGAGGGARAFNLVGSLWHTKKTKFEKKEIPMPIP